MGFPVDSDPGYRPGGTVDAWRVTDVLHLSRRSHLVRATDGQGRTAVLKFLRPPVPSVQELGRFRHAFEIACRFEHPNILRPLQLQSHAGRPYMVLPDLHAVSLRDRLHEGVLDNESAVLLALRLVDALRAIHAQGVIHRDLNPGNILVSPQGLAVVSLTDFGLAAEISSERPLLLRADVVEGSLSTLAPEQTGRMSRDVDYRADFYSLGATLFEALTGEPVFAFNDAAQAVHAHLALPAPLATQRRADVFAPLASIIRHCLHKDPEVRYQSHQTLEQDLTLCLNTLRAGMELRDFQPGLGDQLGRFQISGRLYGREAPLDQLADAFEAAATGPCRLVAVAGFSGIGKTSLVTAAHRSLLAQRGSFAAAKFDQFGQDRPYGALLSTLAQRARQILALPPQRQQIWRERLLGQLGVNAAVVAEAVPEFQALLPEAPAPLALGPAESENRFLRSMRLCLSALAAEGQPQTLFLDDLQWADRASRRLLREWVTDVGLQHTLFVIAYRDNEVPPEHPFSQDLIEFRELGPRFLALQMGPLSLASSTLLLADSLQRSPADVAELATLCQAKTAGNPFFLRRFLEDLVARGLVFFDQGSQHWQWSLASIAQAQMAENVVALMVEQLRALTPACRHALTVAACLGAHFDLATLATALNQHAPVVAGALMPALQGQLIVPASQLYRYAPLLDEAETATSEVRYAFAHDRVQEAAYRLVSSAEHAELHLRIGRLLRSRHQPPHLPFEVLKHFNAAGDLVSDPAERTELAAANEQASVRAMNAAAFDLAADYADRALALRAESDWASEPEALLRLTLHAARMAYLAGRGQRMDSLLDTGLARVRAHMQAGREQQAQLLEVRIEAFYAQGQLTETLDLGLQVLAMLDAELPQAGTPQQVVALIAAARDEIVAMGFDRLTELPPMADARILQLMSLSAKMTAAAYIARPTLLPLLTVFQVRLMLRHGHVPGALSGYSVMGLMCAEFLGDYALAYRLGRMSMDLVQAHGWQQVYAHASFSFNAFLSHWIDPLPQSLPGLMATHQNGLEFGNLRHAGLGLYVHDYHAFLAGQPLASLAASLEAHEQGLRRMRQPVAADYESALLATVRALQSPGLPEQVFGDELADIYAQRKDQTGLMFLHAWRALLFFLAERHEPALREAQAAAGLFAAARGMHAVPLVVFIGAMAGLRIGADHAVANAEEALQKLGRWNAAGPGTFSAKYHILSAELLAAKGQASLPECERAVASAGTPLDAALAQRTRAQLLPEGSAARQQALAEARLHLLQWGAVGAAAALPLAQPRPLQSERGDAADVSSLMKAMQAVTREAALPQLLQRLTEVVAENAGAQRAAIVLAGSAQGDGADPSSRWWLQADARLPAEARVLDHIALEDAAELLPLGVLRQVLATGATVLIDDARSDADASAEPYFRARGTRSALSVALVKQGRTVGALYLENDSASGVFTRGRVEFLELLCANVVNAVDNARLVAELQALTSSLERRVEQRTLELRKTEERLRAILDNAPMPMTLTRRSDGVLIYANEPAARTVNRPLSEIVGRPARRFYRNPQERELILSKYHSQQRLSSEEVCLVAADGSDRWVLLSMVPVVYNDEVADLTTIVDITERKTLELELQRLATTDSLTGAANRRSFLEHASAEIARSRRYDMPMALLMLDIDHFKLINDSLGHAMGDDALRTVHQECSKLVRAQDVIGRLGGEEFAVLLPQTSHEAAMGLAERLRQQIGGIALRKPDQPPDSTHKVTASFGVTVLRPDDRLIDDLLLRADEALYLAKRRGRNCVVGSA